MVRKTYLDSNVLLAVSAGLEKEPDQFRMATRVLDEIGSGDALGTVSSLALMEVITVMRVKKGRETHRLGSMPDDQQSEFVLRESRSMYGKLIAELMKLPGLKFEHGQNMGVGTVMKNALNIIHETGGHVRPSGKSRFSGVGTVDVLHTLLAKNMGCDELVTFDKGFDEMARIAAFEGLTFRILN